LTSCKDCNAWFTRVPWKAYSKLSTLSNSWAVSDQKAVFLVMVHLPFGVTTLEVQFFASRYKFIINNEDIIGEEDE